MPAKNPKTSQFALQQLHALGAAIRARRKALKVSTTAAAESASMSRVTWHRIEKGKPSVTAGAYVNALQVLGMTLSTPETAGQEPWSGTDMIPALISLERYPQLRRLAWHVKDRLQLTAREAHDIYERNQRHLDRQTLGDEERDLIEALKTGFSFHGN